jgi:hypothetical protein
MSAHDCSHLTKLLRADDQSIKLGILCPFRPPSPAPTFPVSPGRNDDKKVRVEQSNLDAHSSLLQSSIWIDPVLSS